MPSIVWNFAETSTVILPAAGVLSLNSTKMGGPRGARGATVGMSSCLVLAAPPPDAVTPGAAAGPGLTPPSAAGSALARESFRKRRMLVEDGSACRGRGSGARGLAARRAGDSYKCESLGLARCRRGARASRWKLPGPAPGEGEDVHAGRLPPCDESGDQRLGP